MPSEKKMNMKIAVLIMLHVTTVAFAVFALYQVLEKSSMAIQQISGIEKDLDRLVNSRPITDKPQSLSEDTGKKSKVRKLINRYKHTCSSAVSLHDTMEVIRSMISNGKIQHSRELTDFQRPRAYVILDSDQHIRYGKVNWAMQTATKSYLCKGVQLKEGVRIKIPLTGFYYVYSQLVFTHKSNGLHRHVTKWKSAFFHESYTRQEQTIMENNYYPTNEEGTQSSFHGTVIELRAGEEIWVHVQMDPGSLLKREHDTSNFFGVHMVS
ncbi:uncharacterized protein LOC100181811 [Ciona intestinalis]